MSRETTAEQLDRPTVSRLPAATRRLPTPDSDSRLTHRRHRRRHHRADRRLRLAQRGHQVTLWERGERLGGQANAFPVAGTAIEHFYHHLFQSDREIVALAEEIGIGDRLLWLPSNVGYFADGRIWPLNGALDLLRLGIPADPGPAARRTRDGLSAAGPRLEAVRIGHRRDVAAPRARAARLRPHLWRAAASEVRALSRSGRDGLVLGQDLVAHDLAPLAARRRATRLLSAAASTS